VGFKNGSVPVDTAVYVSTSLGTALTSNNGAGRLDCDSRRDVGPVTTIRGVYMTQLNRLQRLAALSARNERSF
jgi:hypothetical protein